MKRASTGWKSGIGKPRIASNQTRGLTGYAAKGRRVMEGAGNHNAICCPEAIIEEARILKHATLS